MPKVYLSVSNGIRNAQWRLEPSKFEQLELPIPPLPEQREISKYLDEIAGKYVDLVGASEEFIEVLNERRTSLISAAVTGKIDVRNWKPPPNDNPNKSKKEAA